MQFKVKVIGDSQLRYIRVADLRYRGDLSISYKSGSGIKYAEEVLEDITENRHTETPPDIIVLFTGGNDLDGQYVHLRHLVLRFERFTELAQRMGIQVMIMAPWPRPGARYGAINYVTNKEYFEQKLACDLPDNGWLWRWDKSLPLYSPTFWKEDGVHCRTRHKRKIARYLLSAILAAIRKRRRS